MALLVALQAFLPENPEARRRRWYDLAHQLAQGLEGLGPARVAILDGNDVPLVALDFDETTSGAGP